MPEERQSCLQETEDIELVHIFDPGVGKCKDCPSEL